MKTMGCVIAVLVVVAAGYGVTQAAQSGSAAQRTKFSQQDTEIQGYLCAKGYAMVYSERQAGELQRSRVRRRLERQ
jgi:hypothetical protein